MSELYWPFALAAQVDPPWRDMIAAAAAGQISWDAMAAPVDTGTFTVEPKGVDVPGTAVHEVVPARNRFGLSIVQGSLRAPHITEVVFRPSDRAAIVRIDWIHLRPGCLGGRTRSRFGSRVRASGASASPTAFA